MAMTYSQDMSTTNQYIKYRIGFEETGTNTNNNTSIVNVIVFVWRTNTGYETYDNGTVYCKINGKTYTASVSSSQKITHSGIILFATTLTIPHNDDGTKTLTCSAWINHGRFSSSEQSCNFTLTKIYRASKIISVDGNLIGGTIKFTVDRKSTNFKHNLSYKIGGETSWRHITNNARFDTEYTWTLPMSLCNEVSNSDSIAVTFVVWTDDSTNNWSNVGNDTVTVKLYVPITVVPSCSLSVTDEVGYYNTYGGFVQRKSKFNISITASGSYSSTIQSCSVVADDRTYILSPSNLSLVTDIIKNTGVQTITASVVDSRGRSASASIDVTVLAYNPPVISTMKIERSDSSGVASSNGAYLNAIFNANISSLNNNNSATYVIKYKKKNEVAYTEVTLTELSGIYDASNKNYVFAADTTSSYDVVLTISDDFGTYELSRDGSPCKKLFSFKAGGTGFAIGKVAELDDTFEVYFESKFYNLVNFDGGAHIGKKLTYDIPVCNTGYDCNTMLTPGRYYMEVSASNRPENQNGWLDVMVYSTDWAHQSYAAVNGAAYERWMLSGVWTDWQRSDTAELYSRDYIVAQGQSGNWHYRKWNSGYAEVFVKGSITVGSNGSFSATYTYPIEFVSNPVVNISAGVTGDINTMVKYVSTTNTTFQFYVFGSASKSGWVFIRAVGKWK